VNNQEDDISSKMRESVNVFSRENQGAGGDNLISDHTVEEFESSKDPFHDQV